MQELNAALNEFKIEGNVLSCEAYGSGHINETYLVVSEKKRYILQKINHNLFKNIDQLMSNIELVTEYNRKVTKDKGLDPDKVCLSLVFTNDEKAYYYNGKSFFRVYKFLENTVCYQIVEKPEHFYESAIAFGNFANLLAGFDASKLYEILPNFHNTKNRLENLKKAINADSLGRKKNVMEEINFILKHENLCGIIVDLLESNEMPLKVTHNDTKLNNVLFDDANDKALAVIDLDTIMPGSICYDFGDSIRFGCNPALEDERDLSIVNFRIDLFEEYVKGYLTSLINSITIVEKDNLVNGAILMTLECGMRFLTDYLEGDTYFRTSRDGQNLDRCRTQLKLVKDMLANLEKLENIVDKYYQLFKKED
jgi:Ser/Thr protein kinase RdoA (MazF antagonist)